MSNEVILYDIPSDINGKSICWSLNPWKTRLALNYKQIPYKTSWTEYPDLEPTFKDLGIPPNPKEINTTAYSSPAAKLPNGSFKMDSRLIATELEKLQPTPSLNLDSPLVDRAQAAVNQVLRNMAPNLLTRVPGILPPRSSEYFAATRSVAFGMPLSEFAKAKGGEQAWEAAKGGFEALGQLLRESSGGPYVGGEKEGYADFVVMGLWLFMRVLGESDIWGRVKGMEDGVFEKHFEACKQWAARDD